ncbi:WhiB2 [Mycobacterium lentiflavum]|uniref:Transcriptional regulator WhiB n=1 Tax=Mycobacterium lentiflavum TaxID=141349 RepID=A0A0E4GW24_MYCLN|nr:WhiB family transcriptional regulator [Actinomycetota bacterium]CQD07995.1 WhiB2 [Mycobacterium lentiflavum]
MSYEHLRGVMPSTERAMISSAPAPIARPHLTVVPDAPIAFEPEPLPEPELTPDQWQDRALCAQTDPEAFFPEKGGSTREAKKICLGCEVRHECLEYALAHDERFGIWGGLSERERRRLKRGII